MAAAEVIRYVDPGCVGGTNDGTSWANAYLTLNDLETAEDTDLTLLGGGDGSWMHIYCRSSGAHPADTEAVSIYGWTTSATCYILIEAASTDRAVSTGWDDTKYRLSVTDAHAIDIQEDYVRIDGLQIEVLYSSVAGKSAISYTTIGAGGGYGRVTNCYLRGDTNANANSTAININDAQASVDIWNCCLGPADHRAIYIGAGTAVNIYNCTIYDFDTSGIYTGGTVNVVVRNCAIISTGDDLYDGTSGTWDVDYCALDDADAQTHPVDETAGGQDWDDNFENLATGNFSIKAGANLLAAGVADPSSGLFSNDINRDTRPAAWSVGADDIPTAGGASIVPMAMAYYRRMRV
jgi:hypothetical protein